MGWRSVDRPLRTSPWSAEFTFVLTCASGRGHVPAACGLDPNALAAIAHRHQLVPLVIERMQRSGARVPPALTDRFRPVASLRSAREAVRLHGLLEAAGIVPVFLKGSSLAVLAYGALHRRQFGDIDMLVRVEDVVRAAAVLVEAGYIPEIGTPEALPRTVARLGRLSKDIVLRHPGNGQVVELHWRLTDNPWERPPRRPEDVQWVTLFPGAALPTLATEPLFAYLCAHGAAHGWARLRWLADVAALLARADDGGDRLWQSALAHRQARAAASAILLCESLFDTPPPPSFVRPRSIRLALLVWLSRHVIEAGGGSTELARTRWRGWAETAAKLLVASGPGDLAGWCLRLLCSSADESAADGSRARYLLLPLLRIPRLVARRRARRLSGRAMERAW